MSVAYALADARATESRMSLASSHHVVSQNVDRRSLVRGLNGFGWFEGLHVGAVGVLEFWDLYPYSDTAAFAVLDR